MKTGTGGGGGRAVRESLSLSKSKAQNTQRGDDSSLKRALTATRAVLPLRCARADTAPTRAWLVSMLPG